jgi:tetrahydromethanopterin S-methyltransferase subunit A
MSWMSSMYINDRLNKAQQLLWGGSETENIEAHNIIAKLITDLEFQKITGAD